MPAKKGSIPWNKGGLVKCECKTCYKIFFKHPCRIKTGRGLYCSRSCHSKSRVGEKSGLWKGDKVGYHALHSWVKRKLGKAGYCSFDSSHPSKRYEWANVSRQYKRDLQDWMSLCVSCHKKYDITDEMRFKRKAIGKKVYQLLKLDEKGRFVGKRWEPMHHRKPNGQFASN